MSSHARFAAIFKVRCDGADTNGGGYDATIPSAGTDYSDQAAAQLALTDLQCLVATDATRKTIQSVTGGFTSAMIGNSVNVFTGALNSAGTNNWLPGMYFIMSINSTNQAVLDRSPVNVADSTANANGNVGGSLCRSAQVADSALIAAGYYAAPGNSVKIRASSGVSTGPITTTLGGSLTNVATSTTIASAAGFPTSGNFWVGVDSEIFQVTAYSGTTWSTIVRGRGGTTGASHSSGAVVMLLDTITKDSGNPYIDSTSVFGNLTNGFIRYSSYNGQAVIGSNGLYHFSGSLIAYENAYFAAFGNSNGTQGFVGQSGSGWSVKDCRFNSRGNASMGGCTALNVFGCEFFSDGSASYGSGVFAIRSVTFGGEWYGNYIHDWTGDCFDTQNMTHIHFNVVGGCKGKIGTLAVGSGNWGMGIHNNSIDMKNAGLDCFTTSDATALSITPVFNNIIANVASGKFAFNVTSNSSNVAQNDRCKVFIDYNMYYNCSGTVSGISQGAHDTVLGADPFTNAAAYDYTVTSAIKATAYPTASMPGSSTNRSYLDNGALQRQEPANAPTVIIDQVNVTYMPSEEAVYAT